MSVSSKIPLLRYRLLVNFFENFRGVFFLEIKNFNRGMINLDIFKWQFMQRICSYKLFIYVCVGHTDIIFYENYSLRGVQTWKTICCTDPFDFLSAIFQKNHIFLEQLWLQISVFVVLLQKKNNVLAFLETCRI